MADEVETFAAALTDVSVTIAAGQSLSGPIAMSPSAQNMVRIIMPAAWDPANLTFSASTDGTNYFDVFDWRGSEIAITVRPGTAMAIMQAGAWSQMFNYLMFRSGSRDNPIPQSAPRTFIVSFTAVPVGAVTGGAPGGSNLDMQFNNNGAFGGSGVTAAPNTNSLNVPGSLVVGTPPGGSLGTGTFNSSAQLRVNRDLINPINDTGTFGASALMIQGNTGEFPAFRMTAYQGFPVIEARRANTNSSSPSPPGTNATLFQIRAHGWAGSDWAGTASGLSSAIAFVATETQGVANQGTRIDLSTTPNATAAAAINMTLWGTGLVVGTGATTSANAMGTNTINLAGTGAGYYVNGAATPTSQGFAPTVGWLAGANPNNAIVFVNNTSRTLTVTSVVGVRSVTNSASAPMDIWTAGSGVALTSGTKVTTVAQFDANGTTNTPTSNLTSGAITVPAGNRLGVNVTSGTFDNSVATITVYLQ